MTDTATDRELIKMVVEEAEHLDAIKPNPGVYLICLESTWLLIAERCKAHLEQTEDQS